MFIQGVSSNRLHGRLLLRGCSYGGELSRLGGLARLGERIIIPRSYGIFYLSPVKKFIMYCLIK